MKKKRLTLAQKSSIRGLLFISPFIIGFIVFYLRSIIMTIHFTFSHTTIGEGDTAAGYTTEFAGLANFRHALTEHGTFTQVLTESVGDMMVDVILILFFSLFMAVLLNQKFRGRTLARAIFFLPVILNSQAISESIEMARAMMMGGMSPMSADAVTASASSGVDIRYYIYMFRELGLPIGLIDYVIGAVTRISHIITSSGVQMIIFIAALQSISPSLYEVARIEGATTYETFWKVTFPMVSPLIVTNVVYTFVDSFIRSDVVQLSYDTIFGAARDYSLGSVFSLLSMLVVCLILIVSCALISKRVHYQN